jgi:hypothetical protein
MLVQMLVVAQLLSAAPLVSAMPCAEMHQDECPCCPEGTDSVAACLAACAAAVGITPTLHFALSRAVTPRASLPIVVSLSRDFDPPTKPPPIA